MKSIIKIILFFCVCNLQAQEGVIVDVGTEEAIFAKSGTYIRDTNGTFDPYVGTYTCVWNNKKIIITLQKLVHVTISSSNDSYCYEDCLIGTYKIISLVDGSVIYSDDTAVDYYDFPIHNMGSVHNNRISFSFRDVPERCKFAMELIFYNMNTQSGITTVKYWGLEEGFHVDTDCPYSNPNYIPRIMPKGFYTFTKVN